MNKEIDMLITQLEYRGYIQQDYKHMIIDCLKKYKNLQHQLEEKDNVIDEILNDSWYTDECPIELDNFTKDDEREFDCEDCQDNYKKCWLKYFENQILERGKNGE